VHAQIVKYKIPVQKVTFDIFQSKKRGKVYPYLPNIFNIVFHNSLVLMFAVA
jgi:hypothetical protein